jgi:UDP-N-acetylmuramoyl-L-alanyl-D-glutamate--2,6-diaminopimelate ligase
MMAATQYPAQPSLAHLLQHLVSTEELPALAPSGLTLDSRQVVSGGLFLACAGGRQHGMAFAEQACAQGAAAILAEPAAEWDETALAQAAERLGVPVISVPRLSESAGIIAARFYGDPSAELAVAGITGTNGKTSVSHFLAIALNDDRCCGVLGTLGYGLPGSLRPASHTTPDAVRLQQELAQLREQGADSVAMEVSSHALDQHRVAGVRFHTAVFTNLSHDHLDYHGDMASYGAVKARLFQRPELQLAVINSDDPFGRELVAMCADRMRVIAYGGAQPAPAAVEAVRAERVVSHESGLDFTLQLPAVALPVSSGLLGRFNIDNLLAVAGVLHGWGMAPQQIVTRLESLHTVPGRMERFGAAGQPSVVVDYAHTPDALEQALLALRPHVAGRLHCVFGCGGDRDRAKRPLMGQVAERLADCVIVTDDNPRSEDGDRIVAEILSGMQQPAAVTVQRQRSQAIADAIGQAVPGDLVLVAGKGHEGYQQVGDLRLPFSDAAEVQRALAREAGGVA